MTTLKGLLNESTDIQWCRPPSRYGELRPGFTFNPVTGCNQISPGCAHCYAKTLSLRNPKTLGTWGRDTPRRRTSEAYWKRPIVWNRFAETTQEPLLVFCGSLCDVGEDHPEVEAVWPDLAKLVLATPMLRWILTTKRPHVLSNRLIRHGLAGSRNVFSLVSVENWNRFVELREPIRTLTGLGPTGLSCEPLLEYFPVDAVPVEDGKPTQKPLALSWAILGGESGYGARRCNAAWLKQMACDADRLTIPCFVKQLGAAGYDEEAGTRGPQYRGQPDFQTWTEEGGEPSEWHPSLRVREWPACLLS